VSKRPKSVLFVCIGNSCRSQMAEGFARAYGSDVIVPASAGVRPAMFIAPDTLRAMQAKSIELRDHFPKSLQYVSRARFDLVVNMSGALLPPRTGECIVEWDVADPVAMTYKEHCEVRDQIERMVMELILDLRRDESAPKLRRGILNGPKP
jgi:arsenate reductase